MKRIAMLYADTGGGHRSAAEAIAQGIRVAFPGQFEISFVNNFSTLPFPFSLAEDIYPPMISYARPLYEATFHATNRKAVVQTIKRVVEPASSKVAEKLIHDHPADLYFSVHPFYNHMLPATLQAMHHPAPFVTAVTDLVTAHVQWYSKDVDLCIVPTEFTEAQALEFGIAREKVVVAGQPVWPDFVQRMGHRAETRSALGIDPQRMTVLMMGGGDGMGRMKAFAREIAFSDLPISLVVVCGRNAKLKESLDELKARIPSITTLGFVKNVPELMGASDILLTKAGPGTICEGFIAGLPILLYDAIPGQEEGNVDYVVEHGAGKFCFTSGAAVREIRKWLAHPSYYAAVKRSSLALARPDAAIDIARLAVATLGASPA